VLLACVVLIDLASYITVTLGASGATRMNPPVEKILPCVRDGATVGYTHSSILVQWYDGLVRATRTFVIVESDIFIRFNLRRQV